MILGGQTVQRIRRTVGPKDPFGVPTYTESAPLSISNCNLQPGTPTEDQTPSGDQASIEPMLFAPIDSDILVTDIIRYSTLDYEVTGHPMPWHDLQGAPHHLEIPLKRVTG